MKHFVAEAARILQTTYQESTMTITGLCFISIALMGFIGHIAPCFIERYSAQASRSMWFRFLSLFDGITFELTAIAICFHAPTNVIFVALAAVFAFLGYLSIRNSIFPEPRR